MPAARGLKGGEEAAARPRFAAFDVHYPSGGGGEAFAAGLVFEGWDSDTALETVRCVCAVEAEYAPGAFYKRELGPLLRALDALSAPPGLILVDGYVTLGADEAPGLGWRLWEALDRRTPVIGVAKTRYRGTPEACALRRGRAETPLFITAAGLERETARRGVAAMHGPHRIPTLLKQVDQLSRGRA